MTILKGDQRNRTIFLLERKQQALDLERIVGLFRESRGSYQIQKPLGQGLYTAAYLARDESSDLDVVVRVLRTELVNWPQIRAQFLDLARRSVRLVHQNLVLTREVRSFAELHIYYDVRDYVDGVTLQKLLESGRVFSPDQILKILGQVLRSLTPLHASAIVHGSIKPSNIFLCALDRVILGDLALPLRGFSVQLDRLSYDYRYAAPEMFRQDGTLGPASDFYSVGCVAYELACGAPPFVADNHFELAGLHARETIEPPSQRGSKLGPAGDVFLARLLAKSPTDRPQSLDEALAALDEVRAALVTRQKPCGPSAPILADASLLRYSSDDALSLISFPGELTSLTHRASDNPQTISFAAPGLESGMQTNLTEDTLSFSIETGQEHRSGGVEPVFPQFERYVMRRTLGQGGLSTVYLADDLTLNRQVAIKVSRSASRYKEARARFLNEAMVLAQLVHPNIVAIYDLVQTDDLSGVVLEYVDGGDLGGRLRDQTWTFTDSARLLATLARAVDYAHSNGVLHRDLKPSNILFDKKGTPKITDFGLAKLTGEQEEQTASTTEGTVMGTPAYMSPEQARGQINKIGRGSDIHALGAIFYELIAGRRPFQGGTTMELLMQVQSHQPDRPSKWRPALPRDLDAICLKCLSKEPENRYQTAAALADDLERFLAGQPVASRSRGAWERLRRLFSSKKSLAGQDPPAR